VSVEIPECMVDDELEYMLEDMGMRLQYMYGGMKLEDYFKYTGSSVEAYKKEHAEEAKNGVKTRLVLQALIKKENIDVTDGDLDAEIKKTMPEGKDFDAYKEALEKEQVSRMKNEIVLNKLFDFLFKNNALEVSAADGGAKKSAPAKKKASAAKE
jgi:trigger factor